MAERSMGDRDFDPVVPTEARRYRKLASRSDRMRFRAALASTLLLAVAALCQSGASNKPPSVLDSEAAVARAEAVLIPSTARSRLKANAHSLLP